MRMQLPHIHYEKNMFFTSNTSLFEQQIPSTLEQQCVHGALLLAAAEQVLNHLLDPVMEIVLSYQHMCDNVRLHTVRWHCCVV